MLLFSGTYQPNSDLGRIFLRSLDHTELRHTRAVGRPSTCVQFVSEATSTYTSRSHDTNIHALSGIRARDPSHRAAADVALLGSSSAMFILFMPRQSLVSQGKGKGKAVPSEPGPPHYRDFAIPLTHITLCRTPLDE
jgi:hypothetical protein